MSKILSFLLLATLFAGCESEVRNKTSKNFEKILTQKRKIQNISEEEPTVSEQLTREIHSQMDHSLKKEGKFKFGSK